MTIKSILDILFYNCYDHLPKACYDGTWLCTCQSYPVFLVVVVGVAALILTIIRLGIFDSRYYTERAEYYFYRNYLDYSDRLDNIVK